MDINIRITIAVEVNGERVSEREFVPGVALAEVHAEHERRIDLQRLLDATSPAPFFDSVTDTDGVPETVPRETETADETEPPDATSDVTEQTLMERAGVYTFYDDDQG